MVRAKASLPDGLEIKDSNIPNAGYGIYSTINIKKGTRFGPYIGNKVKMEEVTEETNTSYMWEVRLYIRYSLIESSLTIHDPDS